MVQHFDIKEYLDALQSSRKFGPQVVCNKAFPRRNPSYANPRNKIDHRLLDGLARLGIKQAVHSSGRGVGHYSTGI